MSTEHNRFYNIHVFLQPTSPTTPNKPLAPLDWASGVTTKPDPSVVNKHIRKVVDVRYCQQQYSQILNYDIVLKKIYDIKTFSCPI